MKQYLLAPIWIFVLTLSIKAQTSYTWNGATSTNWGTATNWTPNGIPGGNAGDNVTIVTGSNTCKLNANTAITNITMTSGTLDMGGFTLSPTGNGVFTAGTIQNGTLTINGGTANTAALTNTTFAATSVLNITTGAITLNSGTYGGPVTLTQTGTTSTSGGTGGAVFSSSLTITNNSTGNFRMYGNNTYNGVCTFVNGSSAGDFLPELNRGSTYNNNVTLSNTSTVSNMRMCYAGTNAFNGNMVVSNTGGANFTFCESATATATLATGKTISMGTFNVGTLTLSHFTQTGATAQNLSLSGSGAITINGATTFNGALTMTSTSSGAQTINGASVFNGALTINSTGTSNVTINGADIFQGALTITAQNIYVSASTYNGVTTLTKTDGTNSNNFNGGNTFNNTLTINYTAVTNPTAGSYWGFAANTPDTYNGNLNVNNSSADRILWGVGASAGNQLNGNLVVTQTGSAIGIAIAWSTGTTWAQAAGKNISIGGAGFSVGYLGIGGLTTSSPINLTTTGTSAVYLGTYAGTAPCSFGSTVTVSAPNIYASASTFSGVTTLTKTDGTTSNNMNGGNTFNSTLTINYTAVTNPTVNSYWGFAGNTSDIYNGNVYVNNSSADRILWGVGGNSSVNTQYNGNLIVTQTGLAIGIATAWSTGTTCTMAAGYTISIGGAGFSVGYLGISGLTTSSVVNLTTTGTSAVYIGSVSGNSIPSTFGTTVNITAPDIYVRGGTFNGRAYFTKNAGGSDHNNGFQNIFNASCTINQQSSGGYFMLGYNSNDQFNDSIIVSSTNTGGINLGYNGGTGTPTLASGKSVFVGSAGFSTGYLRFGGFTQLGSTPISLTLTSTAALYVNNNTSGNSTFNAPFYVTAADIIIQGGTFNSRAYFTKTGGANTYGNGVQNIYNGSCNVNQQSSTGFLLLSYNSNDQFNDSIIVTSTGTGGIGLGWNGGNGAPTLASGKSVFVGAAGFSAGYLRFGGFTQLGSAPINLILTSTAVLYVNNNTSGNCTFGGVFNVTAPDIYIQGGIFNGRAYFTKTGGTNNNNNQIQNTFNASCNINQQSSGGYFMLGYNTNDLFNDSIIVSSTGTGAIYFGANNTTGTPTLASGKSVFVGSAGFSTGALYFNHFTQLGSAAINLTLTGTAGIYFQYSSVFGGNVTTVSPTLFFNGSTFNGTTNCTKNGSTSDGGVGGNTFNGVSTFNNSGTGYLMFGNGTADTWNAASTFNNSSSNWIYIGYNSAGNMFNANVSVSSTGSSSGILFCNNAASTATLTSGNTISAGTFNVGSLNINRFTQLGPTAQNITLTGSAVINVNNSSTFNGAITISSPNLYTSNSTYNGVTVLTKTDGTTSNNFAGGNVFNTTLTINYTATNAVGVYWGFGSGSPDTYNGDVYVNNSSTDRILWGVGVSAGTQFNGNLIVTQTGSAVGIATAWAAGSTCTMAAGKTISIGAAGFTTGYLGLCGLTQNGSAPITLTTTGSSSIYVGQYSGIAPSVFGGVTTLTAPDIYVRGGTFNSRAYFTKTGGGNDNNNQQQNIFNASCTINQQSSGGYFMLGYSTNDLFNDSIIVSSTGTGGIYFGANNTTGTPTLASGKSIFVGSAGFSAGILYFNHFTQLGSAAVNLTLTGTAGIYFQYSSVFGGNVTAVSPTLLFNGTTFSGTTNCTKNGNTNDGGSGSNVFTGVSTITNSGSGYLQFGNGSSDQWITNATFNNSGSSTIYVASNSANNTLGGNVTCNVTGTTPGVAIQFCNNANSSATISGNLTINNNGTSGNNNGVRFAEANTSSVTINGTSSITNTSTNTTNYIRFANGTGSNVTFGGNVTATNNGSIGSTNVIHFGYAGTSVFNGSITLTSNGGTGIYFGSSGGNSTQANNMSINTSSFTGGALYIKNFVQVGSTLGNSSNVSISGTNQLLTLTGCTFYDNLTGSSQEITVGTSTFNGSASLTKVSGNANDAWNGGNTFNGTTTITNQATGLALRMANTAADAYNGNVSFVQTGTGAMSPSYNTNCTYAGNITVTSPAGTAITFGSGGATGISTMNGSSGTAQTINLGATGNTPVFTKFVMNTTGTGGVTLNTPINISTSIGLTSGLLNTTVTNVLIMNNGSTAPSIATSSATYVNGPMQYQKSVAGATTLNFPIGNSPDCRPVVLTVNHTTATLYNYTGQLYNASAYPGPGGTYVNFPPSNTVDTLSGVHYWQIARTDNTGTSQPSVGLNVAAGNLPTVTLSFDADDQVYNGSLLTIIKTLSTSTTTWYDIGNGACSIGATQYSTPQAGTITNSATGPTAFNSFSYFSLARLNGAGKNPLPIGLLYFEAAPVNNTVDLTWATATEVNNHYFDIEKSKDGIHFEFLQQVNSEAPNGNSNITLNYKTYDMNPYEGINYYRLKQTDYNGKYTYSNIAQVVFDKKSFVSVYPNPASNNVFINVSSDYDNARLKFTDGLGREVLSQTISSSTINSINTGSLAPGVYVVIVDNGNGEINKTKVTIQQ